MESKNKELLDKAGIKYWNSLEVMILHVSYFFRHYANEFVGIQEVKSMLEFVEKSFPDLVKEVTRLIPLQKMTDIFKTTYPRASIHKRFTHHFRILKRMGPDRKRYCFIN